MNYGEKSHILKWSRTQLREKKYDGSICAGNIGKLKGRENSGPSWIKLKLDIRICFEL